MAGCDVKMRTLDCTTVSTRVSLAEVMLYLPYSYVIMPAK